MKIATWNINSVRLRQNLVEKLILLESPDVICLQETKTVDDTFPRKIFEKHGYRYQALSGMKSYNGVAILARGPFAASSVRAWQGRADCRHIAVTLENGVEIHNFYVPAGGDVPDPIANPKFAHKLGFLDEMKIWALDQKKRGGPLVLVGDLNVAPLEQDVWSHRQMLDVVSHTPAEVSRLLAAQKAGGFVDAVRHVVPESEKLYSWWSYRAKDWEASDRGRRLDHVWVTPDLLPHVASTSILRDARGWAQPSDHVPVLVTLG